VPLFSYESKPPTNLPKNAFSLALGSDFTMLDFEEAERAQKIRRRIGQSRHRRSKQLHHDAAKSRTNRLAESIGHHNLAICINQTFPGDEFGNVGLISHFEDV